MSLRGLPRSERVIGEYGTWKSGGTAIIKLGELWESNKKKQKESDRAMGEWWESSRIMVH